MIQNLIIVGGITLMSSWTWFIFSQNLFIGICCILLSLLLLLIFYNHKPVLLQRFMQTAVICIWVALAMYSFTTSFDKNLFHIAENQYIVVLKRQEIYSREFNSFYRNRFGVYYFNKIQPFIYRYSTNVSNIFDLENLFISKYDEDKYKTRLPLIFLPFMITGLFYLLKIFNKQYAYIMTIILIVSGLLNTKNTLGPIIIYPIIYASIGIGFNKLINLIRRNIIR